MGFKWNALFAIFIFLFPGCKAGREGNCVSDDLAAYQYYPEKLASAVTTTEKYRTPFLPLFVPNVNILDLNFPVRQMWLFAAISILMVKRLRTDCSMKEEVTDAHYI